MLKQIATFDYIIDESGRIDNLAIEFANVRRRVVTLNNPRQESKILFCSSFSNSKVRK